MYKNLRANVSKSKGKCTKNLRVNVERASVLQPTEPTQID